MLLLLLPHSEAAAQTPSDHAPATPFLPPGHWTHEILRRIDAWGINDHHWDASDRVASRSDALRVLTSALERSRTHPQLHRLVSRYLERFAEEFPETVGAASLSGPPTIGGWGEAAYRNSAGLLAAGTGYENDDWSGPLRLTDRSTGSAGGSISAVPVGWLALHARGRVEQDSLELAEAYVVAIWDPVGFWAGRRAVGFGPGRGGAVVLQEQSGLDGAGVFLHDPVILPGFLRALGSVRAETFLSPLAANGNVSDPWLWGARLSLRPHDRVRLGVSRAAMVGGPDGFTLRNLAYILIGKHAGKGSEFDNQIVSLDLAYRVALGAVPLWLYGEWGFDDSAGAWIDMPAWLIGVEAAALPGAPEASLGVEYTRISRRNGPHAIWYRHWEFRDGWTLRRAPLGHPMAGHGEEWLAHGRADLLDARLRLAAGVFLRRRGDENLFAPDREGRSVGTRADVRFRAASMLEVVLEAELEEGASDWRERDVAIGLRYLF